MTRAAWQVLAVGAAIAACGVTLEAVIVNVVLFLSLALLFSWVHPDSLPLEDGFSLASPCVRGHYG